MACLVRTTDDWPVLGFMAFWEALRLSPMDLSSTQEGSPIGDMPEATHDNHLLSLSDVSPRHVAHAPDVLPEDL